MWSAGPAEGPGSWGFEGPEVMNLGARGSGMSFKKSAVKSAGRSSIGGASAISDGKLKETRSAGAYSIVGEEVAGMYSIVECGKASASSVVGKSRLGDVVSKRLIRKRR